MIFNKDIEDATKKACEQDLHSKAIILSKAARIMRRDMFQKSQLFQGKFTQDCQNLSVTPSLLALVNMILYDPGRVRKENSERILQRQAVLSISQLQ